VVEERAQKGLSVEATFVGVSDLRLSEATFDPATREGEVSVRFVGEMTSVVRDRAGDVVEGSPTEIRRQRDVWTFARTMGTATPTGSSSRRGSDPGAGAGRGLGRRGRGGARRHGAVLHDLPGWEADDHGAALDAFRATCDLMDGPDYGPDWRAPCALARGVRPEGARGFFEAYFRPVLVEDGEPPLVTGYYEPEVAGSLRQDARFRVPLLRLPPDAPDGPWHTATEIERGALGGRGLELAWIEDPVDLFFLQVQGSGRVRLPGGALLRVGFAGSNGHPYTSVGGALVARGALREHELSARAIRGWVRDNPGRGRALLRLNASYVFFRDVSDVPPEAGPLGAMGRSVTPMRSVAVDPVHVPLGAPVWVETTGEKPLARLMVAQDVGSAIKGAQRADVFTGTGEAAGEAAGAMRDGGRLAVLLPLRLAALAVEAARRPEVTPRARPAAAEGPPVDRPEGALPRHPTGLPAGPPTSAPRPPPRPLPRAAP
jgi:membrane-bound lytic murein transglycosylase A